MSSLQRIIYLKRAGLLSESSLEDEKIEKKIQDYIEYLKQHDGEDDDEFADDYEHEKRELTEAAKKEEKIGRAHV